MKCNEQTLETRKILIEIYEHEATGWLVAKSDDVPNFYAHGKTVSDVRKQVPPLLRQFFVTGGYCVDAITTDLDKAITGGNFPVKLYANARIEERLTA